MTLTKVPELMLNIDRVVTDFATISAAQAAAIPSEQEFIRTAGHTVMGRGEGLYLRVSSEPVHGGKFFASGSWWELATLEANLYQFGAAGNNSTVDNVAITSWLSYSKYTGASLKVPSGYFLATGVFSIDFRFHITGNGIFVLKDFNGALFNIVVPDGDLEQCVWDGPGVTGAWTDGIIQPNSTMFLLDAASGDLFQFAKIRNFHAERLAFVFRSFATPRSTGFGLEGAMNWCKFRDITVRHVNAIISLEQGSGTGNEYDGLSGFVSSNAGGEGYGYVFGGNGCVVGDIVINGGHFGSILGTGCILTVGPGTTYRSRIHLHGAQADAGMTRVMALEATGIPYEWIDVDVIRGGGVTMGNYPALTNSHLGPNLTSYPAAP